MFAPFTVAFIYAVKVRTFEIIIAQHVDNTKLDQNNVVKEGKATHD